MRSCFNLRDNSELNEMHKSLLILCLVSVVSAQQHKDLDSIHQEQSTPAPIITDQKPLDTIVQPFPQPQEPEYQACTTRNGKNGQCLLFYYCDTNNTIIQDGTYFMDIRSEVRLHRTTRDLPPTEDQSSSFKAVECKYLEECCNLPDVRKEGKKMVNPDPQIRNPNPDCGLRNPDGVDLSQKGDKDGQSKFGEFPWTVAILKIAEYPPGQQINVYVGGGSLIHPAVVLTTAHHVGEIRTLKVRAGEWNYQSTTEIYPHQDRYVDSIIVHEDFNTERNNLFYDIALVFLSSPMDTAVPNVGLACLPPPHQLMRGGQQCVASGWGKDKSGWEGRYSATMKKVTVPVVAREQCQTQLRKTQLKHFFELHSSFMCAGGEAGVDTCTGDGGSALMCPIENQPNRYMQSGMVAWGIECGHEGVPGVYVDVSNLRDWIDDKITGKGLDPMMYTF